MTETPETETPEIQFEYGGMDRVLRDVSRRLGVSVEDWQEIDGDETGVGEDYHYRYPQWDGTEGQDRGNYSDDQDRDNYSGEGDEDAEPNNGWITLYANNDQGYWSWQVTDENDLDIEGGFDSDDDEELDEEPVAPSP